MGRNWNSRRVLERVAWRKLELLAVNAEQEADVIPAEDGAEDRIKFVEKERVGHGEDAMTMGLTLRRTARRINRLNGRVCSFFQAMPHTPQPDPRLPSALHLERYLEVLFLEHPDLRKTRHHDESRFISSDV